MERAVHVKDLLIWVSNLQLTLERLFSVQMLIFVAIGSLNRGLGFFSELFSINKTTIFQNGKQEQPRLPASHHIWHHPHGTDGFPGRLY